LKGTLKIPHAHGPIEMVLTEASPGSAQKQGVGSSKALCNQLGKRVGSFSFPAWNGHQQSVIGEDELLRKELN
jgi:hypothetical protein